MHTQIDGFVRPSGHNGTVPTAPAAIALNYQGGRAVRQLQKSWSGVSANIVELLCDGDLHVDLGAESTRLSVVLEEVGGRFEVRAKNWRSQPTLHPIGQPLSIITAGLEAHGCSSSVCFMRHLVLQLDLATLARMADDEFDLVKGFAPRLMFFDAGVMRLAQLIAAECAEDKPHSRLYGDMLSIALLLALSRPGTGEAPSLRRGQLAPWQLRRVTEYLVAHLAEDVELRTVSDLVGLSRSYFSRAFKMSAGVSPHQWLLQARVAKAKEMLLTSGLPLAQIAVEVGFADQAHFTRTFMRAIGESPGAWKRARCGSWCPPDLSCRSVMDVATSIVAS
jgi:AraC family transcriptional regulator